MATPSPQQAEGPRLEDVEHGVVISHPGADRIERPEALATARHFGMTCQHYGWPGITRTHDGDLLVTASERIRHVDPFGREVIVRSSDNGRTWSAPEVIFDSLSDDRDCAVNTLADGTVVATWFTHDAWRSSRRMIELWQPLLDRLTPDTLLGLSRGWLRRSHDGGRTWEDAVYPTPVGQHAGPAPLADGDLLYCGMSDRSRFEHSRFIATRSSDGGRSWRIVGEIDAGPREYDESNEKWRSSFNENHCLEVEPGHIVCALRTHREPRHVYITHSHDGGQTWGVPRDIGVYGFPAKLAKLADGRVVCVFGDRRAEPRQAIRAVISRDGGETWDTDHVLTIREFDHPADMGYPSLIELGQGELLCIYYYVAHPYPGHVCPAADHVPPERMGILSTRFRLS